MAKVTLFELKEKMNSLNEEIATTAEWIAEKAADPGTPMEEIEKKKAHRDELNTRFELLKKEHDDMEAAQRAQVAMKAGSGAGMDAKTAKIKAKADFYRSAITGGDLKKAYENLGAIPADSQDMGHGDRLLPTNLATELIVEPMLENPMRGIIRMSNITGLEEPRLAFELDGAYDDVTDKDTAKEIQMDGDIRPKGLFPAEPQRGGLMENVRRFGQ